MAILKDVAIYYPRLDPKSPQKKWNPERPQWEVQIRVTSREKNQELRLLGINLKPVVPDEGEPYFKTTLNKKVTKADGTPNEPVKVVDANLNPIDPRNIGNGSLANIRVFQYDYQAGTILKTASVLMAIQITKLVPYEYKPREDFEATETEPSETSESTNFNPDDDIPF